MMKKPTTTAVLLFFSFFIIIITFFVNTITVVTLLSAAPLSSTTTTPPLVCSTSNASFSTNSTSIIRSSEIFTGSTALQPGAAIANIGAWMKLSILQQQQQNNNNNNIIITLFSLFTQDGYPLLTVSVNKDTNFLEIFVSTPSTGQQQTYTTPTPLRIDLFNEIWHFYLLEVNTLSGTINFWIDAIPIVSDFVCGKIITDPNFGAPTTSSSTTTTPISSFQGISGGAYFFIGGQPTPNQQLGNDDDYNSLDQTQYQNIFNGQITDIVYAERIFAQTEIISLFAGIMFIDEGNTNHPCDASGNNILDYSIRVFRPNVFANNDGANNNNNISSINSHQSFKIVQSGDNSNNNNNNINNNKRLMISNDVPRLAPHLPFALPFSPINRTEYSPAQQTCGQKQIAALSSTFKSILETNFAKDHIGKISYDRSSSFRVSIVLKIGNPTPPTTTNVSLFVSSASFNNNNKVLIGSFTPFVNSQFNTDAKPMNFYLSKTVLDDPTLLFFIEADASEHYCLEKIIVTPTTAVSVQVDGLILSSSSSSSTTTRSTGFIFENVATTAVIFDSWNTEGYQNTREAFSIGLVDVSSSSCKNIMMNSNNNDTNKNNSSSSSSSAPLLFFPVSSDSYFGELSLPPLPKSSNNNNWNTTYKICIYPPASSLSSSIAQSFSLPESTGVGISNLAIVSPPDDEDGVKAFPLLSPQITSMLHLGGSEQTDFLADADFDRDYFSSSPSRITEATIRPQNGDQFILDGRNISWTPVSKTDGAFGQLVGSSSSSRASTTGFWVQYYSLALHSSHDLQQIFLELDFSTGIKIWIDDEMIYEGLRSTRTTSTSSSSSLMSISTKFITLQNKGWHQIIVKLFKGTATSNDIGQFYLRVLSRGGGLLSWSFDIPYDQQNNNNNNGSSSYQSLCTNNNNNQQVEIECIPSFSSSTNSISEIESECFNLGCCFSVLNQQDNSFKCVLPPSSSSSSNNNFPKYRRDGRCGPGFLKPGAQTNSDFAQCNPFSSSGAICCSNEGYCSSSSSTSTQQQANNDGSSTSTSCACLGCLDYRYDNNIDNNNNRCRSSQVCENCNCGAFDVNSELVGYNLSKIECQRECEKFNSMKDNIIKDTCVAFTVENEDSATFPKTTSCSLQFTPRTGENCSSLFVADPQVVSLNKLYCNNCKFPSTPVCSNCELKQNAAYSSSSSSSSSSSLLPFTHQITNGNVSSRTQCEQLCLLSPKCVAISFTQTTNTCFFHSQELLAMISNFSSASSNHQNQMTGLYSLVITSSSSSSPSSFNIFSCDGIESNGSPSNPNTKNPKIIQDFDDQQQSTSTIKYSPPYRTIGCFNDMTSSILVGSSANSDDYQTPLPASSFTPISILADWCRSFCFNEVGGAMFFAVSSIYYSGGGPQSVCQCGLRLPPFSTLQKNQVADELCRNIGTNNGAPPQYSMLYVIDQTASSASSTTTTTTTTLNCPEGFIEFNENCYKTFSSSGSSSSTFTNAIDACASQPQEGGKRLQLAGTMDSFKVHNLVSSLPYSAKMSSYIRNNNNNNNDNNNGINLFQLNESISSPAQIADFDLTYNQWLAGTIDETNGDFQWLDGTLWTFSRWSSNLEPSSTEPGNCINNFLKFPLPSAISSSKSDGWRALPCNYGKSSSSSSSSNSNNNNNNVDLPENSNTFVCVTGIKKQQQEIRNTRNDVRRSIMLAEVADGPSSCGAAESLFQSSAGSWDLLMTTTTAKNNNKDGQQPSSSSSSLSFRSSRMNLTMFSSTTGQPVTNYNNEQIKQHHASSQYSNDLIYFNGTTFLKATTTTSTTNTNIDANKVIFPKDNSFSVCAFISPDDTNVDAGLVTQGVSDADDPSTSSSPILVWGLIMLQSRICFVVGGGGNDGSTTTRVCSNMQPTKVALHVCGVFDVTSLSIYIEGKLAKRIRSLPPDLALDYFSVKNNIRRGFVSTTTTSSSSTSNNNNNNNNNKYPPIIVGGYSNSSVVPNTNKFLFKGIIANVYLFDSALTETDTRYLAQCKSAELTGQDYKNSLFYSLPLYKTADTIITLNGHGLSQLVQNDNNIVLSEVACYSLVNYPPNQILSSSSSSATSFFASSMTPTASSINSLSFSVPSDLLLLQNIENSLVDICLVQQQEQQNDDNQLFFSQTIWSKITITVTSIQSFYSPTSSSSTSGNEQLTTSVSGSHFPVTVNFTGTNLAQGQAIALSFDSRCNILVGVFPLIEKKKVVSNDTSSSSSSILNNYYYSIEVDQVYRNTDVWFVCWMPRYYKSFAKSIVNNNNNNNENNNVDNKQQNLKELQQLFFATYQQNNNKNHNKAQLGVVGGSLTNSASSASSFSTLRFTTRFSISVISDFEIKRIAINDGSWKVSSNDYLNGKYIDFQNYVITCKPSSSANTFGDAFVLVVSMGRYVDFYVPRSKDVSLCDLIVDSHTNGKYSDRNPLEKDFDGTYREVPRSFDDDDSTSSSSSSNSLLRQLGGSPLNWPGLEGREYLSSWGVMSPSNDTTDDDFGNNGEDDFRVGGCCSSAFGQDTSWYQSFSLTVFSMKPATIFFNIESPPVAVYLNKTANLVFSFKDVYGDIITSRYAVNFLVTFSDDRILPLVLRPESSTNTDTNNNNTNQQQPIRAQFTVSSTDGFVEGDRMRITIEARSLDDSSSFPIPHNGKILSFETTIVHTPQSHNSNNSLFFIADRSKPVHGTPILQLPFVSVEDINEDVLWSLGGDESARPMLGDSVKLLSTLSTTSWQLSSSNSSYGTLSQIFSNSNNNSISSSVLPSAASSSNSKTYKVGYFSFALYTPSIPYRRRDEQQTVILNMSLLNFDQYFSQNSSSSSSSSNHNALLPSFEVTVFLSGEPIATMQNGNKIHLSDFVIRSPGWQQVLIRIGVTTSSSISSSLDSFMEYLMTRTMRTTTSSSSSGSDDATAMMMINQLVFHTPLLQFTFEGSGLVIATQIPSRFPAGTKLLNRDRPITQMMKSGNLYQYLVTPTTNDFLDLNFLGNGGNDAKANPQVGQQVVLSGSSQGNTASSSSSSSGALVWTEEYISWRTPWAVLASSSNNNNNNNNNNVHEIHFTYLSLALYALEDGAYNFQVNSTTGSPFRVWMDQSILVDCHDDSCSSNSLVVAAVLSRGWHRLLVKFGDTTTKTASSSSSSNNPTTSKYLAAFTITPVFSEDQQDDLAWAFEMPPDLPAGASIIEGPLLHMLQLKDVLDDTVPGIPRGQSDFFPISANTQPSPDEGIFKVKLPLAVNPSSSSSSSSNNNNNNNANNFVLQMQWQPISTQLGNFVNERALGGNFDSYFATAIYSPLAQNFTISARFHDQLLIYLDGQLVYDSSRQFGPNEPNTKAYGRLLLPLPGKFSINTPGWHRLVFKMHAPLDFSVLTFAANTNKSIQDLLGFCSQARRTPCDLASYCPFGYPRLDNQIVENAHPSRDTNIPPSKVIWAPVTHDRDYGNDELENEDANNNPNFDTWMQVGEGGVVSSSSSSNSNETAIQCRTSAKNNNFMPFDRFPSTPPQPLIACCGRDHLPPILQIQLQGKGLGWAYDIPNRTVVPSAPRIRVLNPDANDPLVQFSTDTVGLQVFYTLDGSVPSSTHGVLIDQLDNDTTTTTGGTSSSSTSSPKSIVELRRRNVTVTAVCYSPISNRHSGVSVLFIPILKEMSLGRYSAPQGVPFESSVSDGVDAGQLLFIVRDDINNTLVSNNNNNNNNNKNPLKYAIKTFADCQQLILQQRAPNFIQVDSKKQLTIPPNLDAGNYLVFSLFADATNGPLNAPAVLFPNEFRVKMRPVKFTPNVVVVNTPTTLTLVSSSSTSSDSSSSSSIMTPTFLGGDTIFILPPSQFQNESTCNYDSCNRFAFYSVFPAGTTRKLRLSTQIQGVLPSISFSLRGTIRCLCYLASGGEDASPFFNLWGAVLLSEENALTISHSKQVNDSVILFVSPRIVDNAASIAIEGIFPLLSQANTDGAKIEFVFSGGTSRSNGLPFCNHSAGVSVSITSRHNRVVCNSLIVPSGISGKWKVGLMIDGVVTSRAASTTDDSVTLVPSSPRVKTVQGECARQSSACQDRAVITVLGFGFDTQIITNNVIQLLPLGVTAESSNNNDDQNGNNAAPRLPSSSFYDRMITCVPLSATMIDNDPALNNIGIDSQVTCELVITKGALPSSSQIYYYQFRTRVSVAVQVSSDSYVSVSSGSIVFNGGSSRPGWDTSATASPNENSQSPSSNNNTSNNNNNNDQNNSKGGGVATWEIYMIVVICIVFVMALTVIARIILTKFQRASPENTDGEFLAGEVNEQRRLRNERMRRGREIREELREQQRRGNSSNIRTGPQQEQQGNDTNADSNTANDSRRSGRRRRHQRRALGEDGEVGGNVSSENSASEAWEQPLVTVRTGEDVDV